MGEDISLSELQEIRNKNKRLKELSEAGNASGDNQLAEAMTVSSDIILYLCDVIETKERKAESLRNFLKLQGNPDHE